MKSSKLLVWLLYALLVASLILAVCLIFRQMAFSFATLLLLGLVAIIYIFLFYIKHPQGESDNDRKRRRHSRVVVAVYGILAVYAMSNYFYPSKVVFSNNDHHAIALEGIKTRGISMELAADSPEALFDNHTMAGRIMLNDINREDSTATLYLEGAGLPVYEIVDDGRMAFYQALEGQGNIHSWQPEDSLIFLNERDETAAVLKVEYSKEWKWMKLKNVWNANYILNYQDDNGRPHSDTAPFEGVIRRFYSLASLFPGLDTLHGVDLSKLSLIREKTLRLNRNKWDKKLVSDPLLVSYSNGSGLGAVVSGDKKTLINTAYRIPIRLDAKTRYKIGLDNSTPAFKLCVDTTDYMVVRFEMPMYRLLGTEEYKKGQNDHYTFMVASTLMDKDNNVNSHIPQNILLYDMFDHLDNVYQMQPVFVSFERGRTMDELKLKVLDPDRGQGPMVKAGECLPDIHTSQRNVSWVASLDNFRDPTAQRPDNIADPPSTKSIMIFMSILIVLCLVSMSIKIPYSHTYIEGIAYIVLISTLAIRLTILWRASVFPPTINISLSEFNSWRNPGNTSACVLTILLSIIFVAFVIIVKFLRFIFDGEKGRNLPKWIERLDPYNYYSVWYPQLTREERLDRDGEIFMLVRKLFPQQKQFWLTLWMVVCYILVTLLGYSFKSPFLCVGGPVVLYFIFDFLINQQVGSCWSDDNNNSYSYFCLGLINLMIATLSSMIMDGGFGIIFLIFAAMVMIIKLIDLWGKNSFDEKTKTGVRGWGVLIMAVLIVMAIVFMRKIAVAMIIGSLGSRIIASLVVAGVVALLIWTLSGWERYKLTSIIAVLAVAVLVGGATVVMKNHFVNTPTANRVLVLENEPSNVLGKVTTSLDMRKFFNASLNDWVLETYIERGAEVKPIAGERGQGYFKLQPHSKVGVSWGTQLTDLSVSRFMIAEQSNIVPILVILLFSLMTVLSFFFPADKRWARFLLIQIPLLLTVQSLLVWMAVTRRFIFVGQDFPMMSLSSRVNLILCLVGFLVWTLVAILENIHLNGVVRSPMIHARVREYVRGMIERDPKSPRYRFLERTGWLSTVAVFGVLAAIFVSRPKHDYRDNSAAKADTKEERENKQKSKRGTNDYDVAECVNATQAMIAGAINEWFVEYQDTILSQNKLSDITQLGTPKMILTRFCDSVGYNPYDTSNNIIDNILNQDQNYGPFAKASFDDYLVNKSGRNDIHGFIYIIKHRYISQGEEEENVRYQLDITPRYFQQKMPTRINQTWRGSVGSVATMTNMMPESYTEGNVTVYTIPSAWMADKNQAIIVKPNSENLSVVGRYEPRLLSSGESYYLTQGEVLYGRNVPDLSKYGVGNYIARNVYINGRPDFIYPMQMDFYWARPFAEQVRACMNAKMRAVGAPNEDYEKIMNENIEVTLSIEMTRDLYGVIEQKAPNGNVAVVVADGDGNVQALVDHKKPQYRINPNDSRRKMFVDDSLRMEGMLNRGQEAERFFGNKALTSLNFGPGSSQKPLVWTAVTTQFSGWNWNTLRMARINNTLMHQDSRHRHYHAWSFAGARLDTRDSVSEEKRGKFASIKGDEGGGNSDVDVRFYMRNSSNYYNACMIYIGSHSRERLKAVPPNNAMFNSTSSEWLTRTSGLNKYCDSLFPLIWYDGRLLTFSNPLTANDVENPRAILLAGLEQNLGLQTQSNNNRRTYLHGFLDGNVKINNYYAFPEVSYFNNQGRLGEKGLVNEVAREGIKSSAIGQKTVWIVSALKMAEMFGRMISFNSNYRLTIDPTIQKLPFQEMQTDQDADAYLAMRNQQFVLGLNEVFTSSEGTAHGVYTQKSINGQLSNGRYYIYGKTGTIDGAVRGRDKKKDREEDHLLAVVITNKDLAKLNKVEEYRDLKFYVIYIADFDYKHDKFNWQSNDAAIINTVINSKEFKQYMEGGNL